MATTTTPATFGASLARLNEAVAALDEPARSRTASISPSELDKLDDTLLRLHRCDAAPAWDGHGGPHCVRSLLISGYLARDGLAEVRSLGKLRLKLLVGLLEKTTGSWKDTVEINAWAVEIAHALQSSSPKDDVTPEISKVLTGQAKPEASELSKDASNGPAPHPILPEPSPPVSTHLIGRESLAAQSTFSTASSTRPDTFSHLADSEPEDAFGLSSGDDHKNTTADSSRDADDSWSEVGAVNDGHLGGYEALVDVDDEDASPSVLQSSTSSSERSDASGPTSHDLSHSRSRSLATTMSRGDTTDPLGDESTWAMLANKADIAALNSNETTSDHPSSAGLGIANAPIPSSSYDEHILDTDEGLLPPQDDVQDVADLLHSRKGDKPSLLASPIHLVEDVTTAPSETGVFEAASDSATRNERSADDILVPASLPSVDNPFEDETESLVPQVDWAAAEAAEMSDASIDSLSSYSRRHAQRRGVAHWGVSPKLNGLESDATKEVLQLPAADTSIDSVHEDVLVGGSHRASTPPKDLDGLQRALAALSPRSTASSFSPVEAEPSPLARERQSTVIPLNVVTESPMVAASSTSSAPLDPSSSTGAVPDPQLSALADTQGHATGDMPGYQAESIAEGAAPTSPTAPRPIEAALRPQTPTSTEPPRLIARTPRGASLPRPQLQDESPKPQANAQTSTSPRLPLRKSSGRHSEVSTRESGRRSLADETVSSDDSAHNSIPLPTTSTSNFNLPSPVQLSSTSTKKLRTRTKSDASSEVASELSKSASPGRRFFRAGRKKERSEKSPDRGEGTSMGENTVKPDPPSREGSTKGSKGFGSLFKKASSGNLKADKSPELPQSKSTTSVSNISSAALSQRGPPPRRPSRDVLDQNLLEPLSSDTWSRARSESPSRTIVARPSRNASLTSRNATSTDEPIPNVPLLTQSQRLPPPPLPLTHDEDLSRSLPISSPSSAWSIPPQPNSPSAAPLAQTPPIQQNRFPSAVATPPHSSSSMAFSSSEGFPSPGPNISRSFSSGYAASAPSTPASWRKDQAARDKSHYRVSAGINQLLASMDDLDFGDDDPVASPSQAEETPRPPPAKLPTPSSELHGEPPIPDSRRSSRDGYASLGALMMDS